MEAYFGGIASLWTNPIINTTLIGYYEPGSEPYHIFMTSASSRNYTDDRVPYTTQDGGAYSGYFGGIIENMGSGIDELEAIFVALYIDPDGNAGFLRGGLTGTGYRDINMFEMDGNIYKVEMAEGIGINPSELGSFLWGGSMWSTFGGYHVYGNFGGVGEISGQIDSSLTKAIRTQPWGIYGLTLIGTYGGLTSTFWNAKIGGEGIFGAYEVDGEFYDDQGYWIADVPGTWEGNKLTGSLILQR